MSETVYIPEIFERVVQAVNDNNTFDFTIYYEFGHIMEISQTLAEKDQSDTFKYQKYPLIAFIVDIPENKSKAWFNSDISARFIILNPTEPNYKAKDRLENNFKPTLYPIYEAFIEELESSNEIITNEIECTKIDRYYWGKQSNGNSVENIFNDWLDGIELDKVKLRISNKNCTL